MSDELAIIKPVKVVDLHLSKAGESSNDSFVIIPPKKDGKLESVVCADATLIRREMTTKNQLCPYEVIQRVEHGESVPRYKYSDPNNSTGVGRPPSIQRELPENRPLRLG